MCPFIRSTQHPQRHVSHPYENSALSGEGPAGSWRYTERELSQRSRVGYSWQIYGRLKAHKQLRREIAELERLHQEMQKDKPRTLTQQRREKQQR